MDSSGAAVVDPGLASSIYAAAAELILQAERARPAPPRAYEIQQAPPHVVARASVWTIHLAGDPLTYTLVRHDPSPFVQVF